MYGTREEYGDDVCRVLNLCDCCSSSVSPLLLSLCILPCVATVYAQCREALVCQFFESSCRGRWLFFLTSFNCYLGTVTPFYSSTFALFFTPELQIFFFIRAWTLFSSLTRNLFLQLKLDPVRSICTLYFTVLYCTVFAPYSWVQETLAKRGSEEWS